MGVGEIMTSEENWRPLTPREVEVVRAFERAMREVAIPQLLEERRTREAAWREIANMILD